MFYGRRKMTLNVREPTYIENPLITFEWNKVLIKTDCGHTIVVETKPTKRHKKEEDSED